MRREKPASAAESTTVPTAAAAESPLSLSRLRDAFAAMLGTSREQKPASSQSSPSEVPDEGFGRARAFVCEINPRTVAEAMLFVGRPDNGPISARELAAAMRGVSPGEIETVIRQLNTAYDSDRTPYWIEETGGGFRLVLRDEFQRVRDKFYGRVKEARLSPAVLEVLSVLAYNQPATAEQVNELRGAPSGAALSNLVRRQLIRIERSADGTKSPQYSTTDRFLKLFGLESLEALPRAEELEKT